MRLIDGYILRRVLLPMLAAVGIAMAALLMQRLILLMDLFANRGVPFSLVLEMLGNLAPFYLGIALPAALFIGVLHAGSRLSSDSELDAMRAGGMSLLRLMLPVLALAAVLAVISGYLLGWLQPLTRYNYRALVHAVTDTQWDSAIERGAFFTGFGGKTIWVGDISEDGHTLTKVFVKEKGEDGHNIILTAERGDLLKQPDLELTLSLHNGARSETSANGDTIQSMTFTQLDLPLESIASQPYGPRGGKESELTLTELARYTVNTPDHLDQEDILAQLNERLVRSVSILFLPLLAFPIGISSRRTSKSLRMIVGVLFLISYYEVLQFGEAWVSKGRIGPALALWLPCGIFASCSLWLFWVAERRPGQDPLARIFDDVAALGRFFQRRLPDGLRGAGA
ncbi:LPS export ABC transporter permease LptF [Dongia sp.]|uniref:LPS export ABC transporter permease LptF n=1 Tax=Dongia sp. TaxID=1977262 RepID=UPI0037501719